MIMKTLKYSFPALFIALFSAMFIMSCSSSEEELVSIYKDPESEEAQKQIKIFQLFSINPDDYSEENSSYVTWQLFDYNNNKILIAKNKKNNKLFFGMCNPSTNQVIFKNNDIVLKNTITNNHYDETVVRNLRSIDFSNVIRYDNKDGFVFCVPIVYRSEGEVKNTSAECKCIYAFFYDGLKVVALELGLTSYIHSIYPWYDDSIIFSLDYYDNEYVYCKTNGEELFRSKGLWYRSDDSRASSIPINYYECLWFGIKYTSKYDVLFIERNNCKENTSIWYKETNILSSLKLNHSEDSYKLKYEIEKRNGNIWIIVCKKYDKDGNCVEIRFSLNIDNGDYEVLK